MLHYPLIGSNDDSHYCYYYVSAVGLTSNLSSTFGILVVFENVRYSFSFLSQKLWNSYMLQVLRYSMAFISGASGAGIRDQEVEFLVAW